MSEPTIDNCVLCLDEKVSPLRIDCGHSFCHSCWEQFKSYSDKCSWARRCPICRRPLNGRSSTRRFPFTPLFERAHGTGFLANALMSNGVEGGRSSLFRLIRDTNRNIIPNNCPMHPTSSGALGARVTPTTPQRVGTTPTSDGDNDDVTTNTQT